MCRSSCIFFHILSITYQSEYSDSMSKINIHLEMSCLTRITIPDVHLILVLWLLQRVT